MELVNAWQASDGKLFVEYKECQEHELEPIIDDFLRSNYDTINEGNFNLRKKQILEWERYKNKNT